MPIVQATDVPLQPFPTGRTSPQAPSDYQQIPTDVSEFGALQGKALEQFGAGVEKLATGVGHIAAYQQHVFNQNALDKMLMDHDNAILDTGRGTIDPTTGAKTGTGFLDLRGDAAVQAGIPRKVLDDARADIAAGAPNDTVREMFLRQSRRSRQAADQTFYAHYSQQLEKASQDTGHAQILQGARDAGLATNDDALEEAINLGRSGALKQPDPKSASIISDDHIVGSAIAAQIGKGNWAEAERLLQKYGREKGLLTGDRQETYAAALRAHTRRDKMRDLSAEANGDAPTGGAGGEGPTRPLGPEAGGAVTTQQVADAGARNGVPAPMANAFAGIESKHGAAPDRSGSQYRGIFQLGSEERVSVGGSASSKGSLDDQLDHGTKFIAQLIPKTQEILGRKPENWEVYMVHQQGPTGFPRLRDNPNTLLKDLPGDAYTNALSNPDGATKDQVANMTAGQFLNLWRDRYNREEAQYRNIVPTAGTQVAAGPSLTATDASQGGLPRQALPATGPAAEVAADVAAEGGAAPPAIAPTAPRAGPKPMLSLEKVLSNAAAIADREGLSDDDRDALIRRAQSDYSLKRAKTEDQRKRLSDELVNGEALLRDGRPYAVDEAKLRSLVEPAEADKAIQRLQDAEDQGSATIAISRLSPSEAVQWQRSISQDAEKYPQGAARRLRYLDHFNTAIQHRNELLNGEHADPANYLIARDQKMPPPPDGPPSLAALHDASTSGNPVAIARYAQATLDEQARLGVLPEKQRLLTNNEAAAQAQHIAGTDPGTEDVGLRLGQMQQAYGQYWPQAFKDMVHAGLPREAKLLGGMSADAQAVARQDMQRAIQLAHEKGGVGPLKEQIAKADQQTINDTAIANTADFRRSNPDPDLSADMQNGIEHLAYYYMYRGDSASAAVKKATQGLIDAKYDFSGTLRVPKGTAGIMEGAADAVQHHIRPEDLAYNIPGPANLSPETRRATMLDGLRGGYWRTNPGDDGALLYLRTRDGREVEARLAPQPGQQVGPQIEFKWSDARRLSQLAPPLGLSGEVGPGGELSMPVAPDRGFVPLGYRALMAPSMRPPT